MLHPPEQNSHLPHWNDRSENHKELMRDKFAHLLSLMTYLTSNSDSSLKYMLHKSWLIERMEKISSVLIMIVNHSTLI